MVDGQLVVNGISCEISIRFNLNNFHCHTSIIPGYCFNVASSFTNFESSFLFSLTKKSPEISIFSNLTIFYNWGPIILPEEVTLSNIFGRVFYFYCRNTLLVQWFKSEGSWLKVLSKNRRKNMWWSPFGVELQTPTMTFLCEEKLHKGCFSSIFEMFKTFLNGFFWRIKKPKSKLTFFFDLRFLCG